MTNLPPLAEQLRPSDFDDYVGQQHLIGNDGILRKAVESGTLPSIILWGPPGVGKTTLAHIIANKLQKPFFTLSAINSGVKDIREVIENARNSGKNALLFIDEIHRFSKSQQDSLLSAVEKGIITLIGATTENPSFEVISPLLSRCQVYILKPLDENDLRIITAKALAKIKVLTGIEIRIREDEALLRISGGDARKLLNALEIIAGVQHPDGNIIEIDNRSALKVIQQNLAMYDKKGEMHYDIISAFIKSMRGSDPNAAVYWLARMIESGEDPKFIARRMLILASEDIGNANPNALLLANTCFDAVHKTGYPECRIILSQCAVYLACSPKSNASYMAIEEALAAVRNKGDLPVPLPIRNAPTGLMKNLGYGADYRYAHSYEGNFAEMEFLPEKLSGTRFYEPGKNPREEEIRKYLKNLWKNKYQY
ncbi:replication-associated recombination protein A [Lentimicrobium sp.]|jgi:putative ATPase|uniref:replication-associated recombination protein A n=1 Tax=Lentimicrobium sp. TaxID=2034841 RepID=UPI0025D8E8D0|nr:replication-associated recombination protein A [Lentimicrobium sp.]MCO5255255.1 replication-associated recombination protein A [Lentimicrobium sp.]MCO5262906.1 replication-associated recombination protein A [Lentimicrobium sp.]HPF64322.1 replication-associated recombination protein A [Lentimicrobium sp.]HPJ61141.1 replication-associated recombination protein A [Lentimicrobium sp.]HPR26025.1 replication-associated recombination protein A [Lentimicrobium sp.]